MKATVACSAQVLEENVVRFGFIDAVGNSVSLPLTREQVESYVIMLTRFVDSDARTRIVAVLEEM